jgi:hypothetical protein
MSLADMLSQQMQAKQFILSFETTEVGLLNGA